MEPSYRMPGRGKNCRQKLPHFARALPQIAAPLVSRAAAALQKCHETPAESAHSVLVDIWHDVCF
jgi:hypothetical protein